MNIDKICGHIPNIHNNTNICNFTPWPLPLLSPLFQQCYFENFLHKLYGRVPVQNLLGRIAKFLNTIRIRINDTHINKANGSLSPPILSSKNFTPPPLLPCGSILVVEGLRFR